MEQGKMKSLDFRRYVLGICAATMLLAGCGGSQPSIGAAGAMAQAEAVGTHAEPGRSWMLPGASGEDLLYAPVPDSDVVDVFSYPNGKLVGTLTGFDYPLGECVNTAGDVWIVNGGDANRGSSSIVEYAHGGTSPIATLTGMGEYPNACSVDPKTGNLAVTSLYPASIAIFAEAQGYPTIYTDSNMQYMEYCVYDNKSNLYVGGVLGAFALGRFLSRSGTFTAITIPHDSGKQTIKSGASLQWDGKYLVIAQKPGLGTDTVYRLRASGNSVSFVGSFRIRGVRRPFGQPWIQNNTITFNHTGGCCSRVDLWPYPRGGKPTRVIELGRASGYEWQPGVAVSLGTK
jgi:hypothetical protein